MVLIVSLEGCCELREGWCAKSVAPATLVYVYFRRIAARVRWYWPVLGLMFRWWKVCLACCAHSWVLEQCGRNRRVGS